MLYSVSNDHLTTRRVLRYEVVIGFLLLSGVIVLPFLAVPWLIVDDATHAADAIVVLGGEAYPPNRTIHALTLYNEHRAAVIVFAGGALPGRSPETSSARVSLRHALVRGLPPDVALLADGAQSTYDEAMLVRDLVLTNGWRSLLIVTDPYHTRRAVHTFRALIPEARVTVSAAPFLDSCADVWRCRARVWRYATSELVKIGFYRLRYGVSSL